MEHLRYLESQFLNEKYADINFFIETEMGTVKIPSHKVILSAGSYQFSKRFTDSVELKKIEIFNVTQSSFEEFLFAFYSSCPEKNFTIANAAKVLTLAKTFEVVHCIKACERFLIKSLSLSQICFGYCLAIEFGLADLKIHCFKQINEKKHDVFLTPSFFACDRDALNDILENVTINNDDEIEIVWNACMNWAEKQCIMRSIDSVDMGNRRELLGKCFNQIHMIAGKDGEFLKSVMEKYQGLFGNDAKPLELSTKTDCDTKDGGYVNEKEDVNHNVSENEDVNHNARDDVMFARFREIMLSPNTCFANVPVSIEFKSTKPIALNGIAFSTVTGTPKGKITILQDGKVIAEQQIHSIRHDPKNFIAFDNIILNADKYYSIEVVFSKDIIYRSSRRVSNTCLAEDFTVSIKPSRRDIFSHFSFGECF